MGSGGAVARIGGGGADEDAGGKRDGIVEEGSATRSRGIERASRAGMTCDVGGAGIVGMPCDGEGAAGIARRAVSIGRIQ